MNDAAGLRRASAHFAILCAAFLVSVHCLFGVSAIISLISSFLSSPVSRHSFRLTYAYLAGIHASCCWNQRRTRQCRRLD